MRRQPLSLASFGAIVRHVTRTDPTPTSPPARKSSRDVDQALKDSAIAMLRRDGVFADFSLAQIAEEAQVNRSVAYRHFGSRQELLRDATRERTGSDAEIDAAFRAREHLPFADRYMGAFDEAIKHHERAILGALRLLDGAPDARALHGNEPLARLLRDHSTGVLDPETDVRGVRAAAYALRIGYAIFRTWLAEEQFIEPDELDDVVRPLVSRMLHSLEADGQANS